MVSVGTEIVLAGSLSAVVRSFMADDAAIALVTGQMTESALQSRSGSKDRRDRGSEHAGSANSNPLPGSFDSTCNERMISMIRSALSRKITISAVPAGTYLDNLVNYGYQFTGDNMNDTISSNAWNLTGC
jgi:hypothetical protein